MKFVHSKYYEKVRKGERLGYSNLSAVLDSLEAKNQTLIIGSADIILDIIASSPKILSHQHAENTTIKTSTTFQQRLFALVLPRLLNARKERSSETIEKILINLIVQTPFQIVKPQLKNLLPLLTSTMLTQTNQELMV
jgi:hypothetical protein